MALDASVLVDLPEHGIAYKKVSGKTYVYYVTATYRNKNGNPTCDRSSIGRLDETSGKLIPNRNYYEIFLKQPIPPAGDLFCCGVFDVFDRVCDTLGVKKLLKRYFPEHCMEILTVAQYLLSEGNVLYYIDAYTETHRTAAGGVLSDANCSRMLSSLRQEDRMLFFREKNEYIAYDATSISSYSRNITELEWGYNRDKEKLLQINLGLYYGEESRLPLYYRVYPGSISDTEGNMMFRLVQTVLGDADEDDILLDNENDPITTMYVNGNEGILVEYPDVPGLYYLVWQDDSYQYSLYGSFRSVSELMKIAKGIRTE